jgi:orotate phosphoribosyltransferase
MNYRTRLRPPARRQRVHRMATSTHPLSAHVHLGDPRMVSELLATPGALLDGHFGLLSGQHSDRFVAFSRIAADVAALDVLAAWLLPTVAAGAPDVVIAPRTAGVALGWTLARRLSAPLHLASVDDQGRPDGLLGSPDLRGARVLVVNDVVTTGDGLRALARLVDSAGASAVGAAWFLSRSEIAISADLGVPTAHVVTAELPSWPCEECSLCRENVHLVPGLDLN